jgi:hypothetical protein
MTDKSMLIVDSNLVQKIDKNRGDMGRSEFISFLIDNQLKDEEVSVENNFVSREEFQQFHQGIKELLRNFLDFFLSYGLELGEQPKDQTFEELVKKLQVLAGSGNKNKPLK